MRVAVLLMENVSWYPKANTNLDMSIMKPLLTTAAQRSWFTMQSWNLMSLQDSQLIVSITPRN